MIRDRRARTAWEVALFALSLLVVSTAGAESPKARSNEIVGSLHETARQAEALRQATGSTIPVREKNASWQAIVKKARSDYLEHETLCRAAAETKDPCADQNVKVAKLHLLEAVSSYVRWLAEKIERRGKDDTMSSQELVQTLHAQLAASPTVGPDEIGALIGDLTRRGLMSDEERKMLARELRKAAQKNDASAVQLAFQIVQATSDRTRREQLVEQLKALGNQALTDAVERVSPNDEGSYARLLDALRLADAAVRAQAAGITRQLDPEFPASGTWLHVVFFDDQKPTGAIDVRRDFRQATKELLTAVTVNGIAKPELITTADPDPEYAKRVCSCADKPVSVCGGVLGIQLRKGQDGNVVPIGRLVRNEKPTKTVCDGCRGTSCPTLGLTAASFVKGDEPLRPCADAGNCVFNAKSAAFAFLARLRQTMNLFSEFRELPFWSDRKRTSISIGPSLHPNVGLSDLQEPFAHTVPKKFVSGLGLKIEGDCPRGFREGLVYRLGHGYETIVGEQIGSPKGAAPVLTLSVPRGNTSGEVCMARLKYDGNDLYGVTATALAPHMGDAGDDVARVIGQFYRDVQAAHYGSGGGNDEGRKERKPPPFSHALIFSGARQLEYSDFKDGWGWVAGESALLIAGVTFTALSIAERNDQPSVDPDLDKARVYQGISYGAFGAIIPLRLFAGWAFSF